MSGVFKAVGKVFKTVVHAVGKVVSFIADNWKTIAIAAAVIYTGGLAAGAWGAASAGAAGASGGLAAAGSAAGAATAGAGAEASIGIMAGSTAASTAAAAAGGTFGIGASTIGASGLAAGLGGSVGAAGLAESAAGYTLADGAGGLGSSMPQAGLLQTGSTGTGSAFSSAYSSVQQVGGNAFSDSVTTGTTSPGGFWSSVGNTLKSDAMSVKNAVFGSAPANDSAAATIDSTGTTAGAAGGATSAATSAASSGMPMWAKLQLASTAFNGISGYLSGKAQYAPPNNFSGRNGGGSGGGIGLHTTNGGFGIATGGSTPAPEGLPSGLAGGGSQAPSSPGQSLSNSGTQGSNAAAPTGNIGQTVANSAGVGGLIPQGAVNFMGPK